MSLTLPEKLVPVLGHLGHMEASLTLNLEGLFIWAPSAVDLPRVRFGLEARDANLVRCLFLDSVRSDYARESIRGAWRRAVPPPAAAPLDVLTAKNAYVEVLAARRQGHATVQQVRQAKSQFEGAVKRDVIAPLQKQLLECRDPLVKAAGGGLAEAAQMIYLMGPALLDMFVQSLAEPDNEVLALAFQKLLGQHGDLAGRFSRMTLDLVRLRD